MGQNFEQAKRENTFWTRPNILKNVVFLSKPFFFRIFFSHLEKPVTMKNGKNPKDVLANLINFEPSAT